LITGCGELRIAEHPDQVCVDLRVMRREELLDEASGLILLPRAAHRHALAESPADADSGIEGGDHEASGGRRDDG
jgi:hypothetical protein